MHQILVENKATIAAVVIIAVITVLFCIMAVKMIQNAGLEKVRARVYKGFIEAENRFKQGENSEKFEYVVDIAQKALPLPFSLFITESLLRSVVQLWFDLCKDLLDNGRLDLSIKEDESEVDTL